MLDETIDLPDTAAAAVTDIPSSNGVVVDEVLVEEVSIDGMCGVY